MINKSRSENQSEQELNNCSLELVEVLLQNSLCYPWNPAIEDLESIYLSSERTLDLCEELNEQEIEENSNNLFLSLENCWHSIPTKKDIRLTLQGRFGNLVPTLYLEMIANNAHKVIKENLEPLNQLVDCVCPLWDKWLLEDLQVLARPLAFAMRGSSTIEIASWEGLSEIERIRLTLLIAHQAIQELSTPE